ncbi:phosphatase PAP2 family protein [Micromonospora craniellae]|uniref:PAP2 family protein n=1 Tax=Micromonospora craniellae TaxID=2294034 RepID=A0A372G2D2_9ACTN|nr:phosphatase PAP2 family protein [Micromonospora craniellae]QOC95110.1 phosphatase PAP2 family protein [Micromonospora craniellae]RFS47098.1 PAP2 family protein [Micromonospora craniellae]
MLVPSVVLAMLVVGDWSPLRRLDAAVTADLHDFAHDHPAWVGVMSLWTDVFAPMPLRAAALFLVIWLAYRGARRLAAWVTATMVFGGLLGPLLKLVVGRPRPDLPDPVALAPGLAFPSGHALNAALAAGVLLVVFLPRTRARSAARAAVWSAALLIALVTGFSRVALGVHWSSDVVAGWLLGTAVVTATTVAFTLRSRPSPHDG